MTDVSPFEKMDRMYRFQRFFYDVSRKYYLLGRDRLLEEMAVTPDSLVLEVGCGTVRNLILLAQQYPDSHFFGLDASAAMLETAQKNISGRKLENISLAHGLAGEYSHEATFGSRRPFDLVFFSYSLSMITDWHGTLDNALANLGPGGTVYIVDFYDQAELPSAFRRFLQWWLALFGVRYDPEIGEYLSDPGSGLESTLTPLYRRYSFIEKLKKPAR